MSSWHSVFLIYLGLIAACSQTPQVDETTTEATRLSFSGFFAPFLPLEIIVHSDNSLTWRNPPDRGGTGRVCPAESEMICLVLDGGWIFAIPKSIVAHPLLGQSWIFEQVEFELYDVFRYPSISQESEILVVKPGNSSTGWLLFHFDVQAGLEAITFVNSNWEPDRWDQGFIPVIEIKMRGH